MIHTFATYCLAGAALAMTPPTPAPPAAPVVIAKPKLEPVKVKTAKPDARLRGKPTTGKPAVKTKPEAKPTPAPAGPAAAVAERVQRFYEKTDDLQANFIQTYTRVALSRTSESRGKVTLKKPGMMRWDYAKPEVKHFIADGKRLVVYEPEEEQVIIDPSFRAEELSSSVSFLWGQGNLHASFTIELAGEKGDHTVLAMTPKKDATYKKLILVVETATGKVLESELHEASGNTNHFKFLDVKTNVGIDAHFFDFTPPPGVEVVERP